MQLEASKTSKGTLPKLAIILNTDGTRAGCAVVCEAQFVYVPSQLTETVRFNVYILCLGFILFQTFSITGFHGTLCV